MNRILILFCFLCLQIGCVSVPKTKPGDNSFLYPDSDFESETKYTPWKGLESNGITNRDDYVRDLTAFVSLSKIIKTNEVDAMFQDPFQTNENMPQVTFCTPLPAEVVSKYYQKQFTQHGWQEVRQELIIEQCYGDGDWIRVYKKNAALVRLHIMGMWEQASDEKQWFLQGTFISRSIIFTFIGMQPSELLGNNYTNKQDVYQYMEKNGYINTEPKESK